MVELRHVPTDAPLMTAEARRIMATTKARGCQWRRALRGYLFLLPTFAVILGFSYYPVGRALLGAFTTWNGFSSPVWVGFSNFSQLFHDPTFIASLGHVLLWSLVGIPLAIVPAFITAELIFHLRSQRSQYVYRSLLVLSLVIPGLVIILVWQYIYAPTGVLNDVLRSIGLSALRHQWIADPQYALWALILMQFPWVNAFSMMIFYAGLQAVQPEVFDAAAIDGAVSWKRVLRVDLSMVLPQLKLVLILSIIAVSQNLLVPLLMTGGGPGTATTTPVYYMYNTAINYDEYGYAFAIAFVLFLIVMLLSVMSMRLFQTGEAKR